MTNTSSITRKAKAGKLILPCNKGRYFKIYAGRYVEIPRGMAGVKMAKEINKKCVIDIPTADFQTPTMERLDAGLAKAIPMILEGKRLYVGCMGGVGRTGLFLAILAKAFGVENPVEYVRKGYNPHAVETKDQMMFVECYQVSKALLWKIRVARIFAWFKHKGSLTK